MPANIVPSFLPCWFSGMRNPKCQLVVLTSSSMDSLLCLLVEAYLPLDWDIETWRAQGDGNWKQKFCQCINKGNGEWCHIYFQLLIPKPINYGSGKNSTIYQMTFQSIYSLLVSVASILQDISTWILYLSPQRAIPLFFQANCFMMRGNMVRPVNSCCEISWIRSNNMWHAW